MHDLASLAPSSPTKEPLHFAAHDGTGPKEVFMSGKEFGAMRPTVGDNAIEKALSHKRVGQILEGFVRDPIIVAKVEKALNEFDNRPPNKKYGPSRAQVIRTALVELLAEDYPA